MYRFTSSLDISPFQDLISYISKVCIVHNAAKKAQSQNEHPANAPFNTRKFTKTDETHNAVLESQIQNIK